MANVGDLLSREDIKIGDRVKVSQLEDIFDTYIVLGDVRLVKNNIGIGTFEGIIEVISDEPVRLTKPNTTLVYNNSMYKESYCEYE